MTERFFKQTRQLVPETAVGPLVTNDGQVIGVNTWRVRPDVGEALGFAVPINDAKSVFSEFIK